MAKKKRTSINPIEKEMDELLPKKENPFDKVKLNFKCKNKKQKECVKTIKEKNITFIESPSGCGKSAVTIATATELVKDRNTPYERIVLVVAPVQVDMEVGHLPGDLVDGKLMPFSSPCLGNLADFIGGMDKVNELINAGGIEITSISFCRGVNFKNCIVVIDEAQQYQESSILTLLTRLCDSAKMILCFDQYQCDNKYIKRGKEKSGIEKAKSCLLDIPQVGFVEFDLTHIVRNPIISQILSKWDPEVYGYLNNKDVGKNANDLDDEKEKE